MSGTLTILANDALLLLTAGIWGSAFVAQRLGMEHVGPCTYTAIRFALGAQAANIWRLVFAQGFRHLAIGLAIGLVLAFGLSRFITALLVGVSPDDPTVYLLVIAIIALVALLAAAWPARRAAKVDPMVALRDQ